MSMRRGVFKIPRVYVMKNDKQLYKTLIDEVTNDPDTAKSLKIYHDIRFYKCSVVEKP